eukprot:GHVU01215759.1.p3 GENE.GHVU01215759.1~~GHVU01215759.1.p3  ORF type:complete len:241 (-),score=56.04 GHVU01215759.1:3590-4312(-)
MFKRAPHILELLEGVSSDEDDSSDTDSDASEDKADISKDGSSGSSSGSSSGGETDDLDGVDGHFHESEEESEGEALPSAPEVQPETHHRGNFRCISCPEKILLTEKELEKHLASKAHSKRLKTEVKAGKEREKLVADLNAQVFGPSNTTAEEDHTESQSDEGIEEEDGRGKDAEGSNAVTKKNKRKRRQTKSRATAPGAPQPRQKKSHADLTADQIEKRKETFQRKKARRMSRKGQEEVA